MFTARHFSLFFLTYNDQNFHNMPRVQELTRLQILSLIDDGLSQRQVAATCNVSKFTVQHLIKKRQLNQGIADLPKTGRPKKLSAAEERRVVITCKKNPRLTARNVLYESEMANKVSLSTAKRILRRANLYGRVALKKAFISKQN